MIKIIDLNSVQMTEFEKKYMFTEAPGEERVNVKRITLKAPDKRTYDFKKGADDEEDTQEQPVPDDTEEPDIVEDPGDTEDQETDTEGEDLPEEDTETDDIVTDDNGDIPTDDEGMDDITVDDGGEDVDVDDTQGDTGDTGDGGNGTDDIVVDDNEDVPTDDGDAGGDQGTEEQPDDTSGDGDENGGQEDQQEKIHKQNLFKRFITLHTSIENYSHKLSSIIGVDSDTHKMISEVSEKLNQLGDMLYDYMILKFKKSTYLESMLFYQRTVAATNLCLDSLSKINSISSDVNSTKKSNKK